MGYTKLLNKFLNIDLQEMRPSGFHANISMRIKDMNDKVLHKGGFKPVDQCPLCDSGDRKVEFSKFDIDIMACLKCSLRYAALIPNDTSDVYSDSAYLPAAFESYMKNISYRKKRFGKERIDLITSYMVSLEAKRLLDIGCGTGWFLEVAQEQGMEVCGQELGKELSAWTRERLGVEIFNVELFRIPHQRKFDVITMFDLIEHVPNPMQLITEAKSRLASGGIILIFTPNFDSLAVNIMREESSMITPAEHLVYFTKESIHFFAQKAGLKVAYYQTCGIDLGDLKSYYERQGDSCLSASYEKIFPQIQPLVDAAGAGNHMRVILEV